MADANHSDRARLVRFWASARGFWGGKSAMVAWPLTVGLVVIAISQLSVQYRLNYWNRDFFNALARRDGGALWHQVAVFVPLAIMSVGLSVVSVWARMTTQRKWRQWLTTNKARRGHQSEGSPKDGGGRDVRRMRRSANGGHAAVLA
jgi:putative ATP-binding cassette transporter